MTSARLMPALLTIALIVGGCASKPSRANIALRKENKTLGDQLDTLRRQRAADSASIAAYQHANGSLQTLPQPQIDQLFTTHGLKIKRLTGGYESDASKAGDDALKVYFVPTDEQDQPIKAVGEARVEAFGDKSDQPTQHWDFSREQVKAAWLGQALQYEFVLVCPFQTRPATSKLTVKILFTDALTGRQFTADKAITIKPN